MINHPVLVLNQNYEPLNICRVRRAIVLVYRGKAEMLENGLGFLQTSSLMFEVPSIIRLIYLIKRPRQVRKLSRVEVFNRDQYSCQYCGKKGITSMTIDHVIPRSLNGKHIWENVVTACIPCNRHKAGRTPNQARMRLLKLPRPPSKAISLSIPYHHQGERTEWQKYLANS